ncbi:RagB/SusD family nutrient uptake outer membrane protein [Pedobacter frigidisoli]|uniref:RagB/SusD family nutrient uptake outer membrane protein n=1 Tax=Pedobacter frigidisoli TaxID=2530455 RepID=UPI00292FA0F8|nr:RagB/SusD family nutrient uptake outer membrane protein [Pedobacter frigidisoli]
MKNKFLLAILIITFSSCKKFVEVDAPTTQAELSRVFESDQTAIAAATGLYAQMIASGLTFANGGMTIYPGLSADELVNTLSSTGTDAYKNNQLLSDDATVLSTFWSNPYKNIYHANAVIEGLQNSTAISTKLRDRLLAEMLYIRALHYLYMINLFGSVPYITSTDYDLNSNLSRTEVPTIYPQLIADLLQAKSYLNNNTTETNRVNKETVTGLLARVYLYNEDWQNAITQATEVIASGKYSLEPLANVFLATSKESLLSLARPTANVSEATTLIPSSTTVRPTYAIHSNLLVAFENGDNRKTSWLKSNTVSSVVYYYANKYKVRSSTTVTENYIVQRLAELYLIRAEAKTQLGDLSGAITDVDVIRQRAGLSLIKNTNPNISKEALLNAIMKERQIELFCEWGHRWFDLKRTQKVNNLFSILKAATWKPYAALYPIPLAEIKKNPNLTQNEGYTN